MNDVQYLILRKKGKFYFCHCNYIINACTSRCGYSALEWTMYGYLDFPWFWKYGFFQVWESPFQISDTADLEM